jgi:raffinose/stachyose/melibiose transport system substrate-binding protein
MQKRAGLLILAMMLALSLFLTACGGNNANDSGSNNQSQNQNGSQEETENKNQKKNDEPVDLVWITHSPETEAERELYQVDVVDAFEAKYPNVTVKWVEAQDSYSLIRQQLAAGAGPDIVSTGGPTFLSEYVKSNYLLPLNPYVEKYKWDERFYDWALDAGKIGDQVYGLPGSYETLLVWYNKEMFAANGLGCSGEL